MSVDSVPSIVPSGDPPSTPSARKKASLERILRDVFELEDDDLLVKAIEAQGVVTIDDALSLSSEDIDRLETTSGKKRLPLLQARKNLLKILREWNYYLQVSKGLKNVDWDNPNIVNADEFSHFRTSVYDPDKSLRETLGTTLKYQDLLAPANSPVNFPTKGTKDLAYEFRKGVKRDKSHYTPLKDEKHYDDWRRKTVSTARAHGCENILDVTFSPKTEQEDALFQEQSKFMYDVFNTILLTDIGKHFVRKHSSTGNAQKVWIDYEAHMNTSTRAEVEIENIMTRLTTSRLNEHNKVAKFVTDWLHLLRRYEDMKPISEHFPDTLKKQLLQNAIIDLKVFRDIKLSEEIKIAQGNPAMTYQEYLVVVQRAATAEDERNLKSTSAPKGIVTNTHQLDYDTHDDGDDDDYGYDNELHAYAAQRRYYRKPSLKKDVWDALEPVEQKKWDLLSDKSKRTIIFGCGNKKETNPTTTTTNTNSNTRTVRFASASSDTEEDLETTTNHDNDHHEDNTLLINAASSKSRKPTPTLRNILGDLPSPPSKRSTNKPTGLNINTALTYHVSQAGTYDNHALVDRGANGGIAGDNVRIISKTDRKVNVNGIDNHQMTDLTIVTAGGVVPTQRGDVLVILHQYAHAGLGKTIHSSVQLEHFENNVDDRSLRVPGATQSITTLDGYIIPLRFREGLPYMPIRPYSDREWQTLPHVVLTSDEEWDPIVMDTSRDEDAWLDNQPHDPTNMPFRPFDRFGDYTVNKLKWNWVTENTPVHYDREINLRNVATVEPDYFHLKPYFLDADVNIIKKTFQNTTQFARGGVIHGTIFDTHRAPFPALNVPRRNEPVATDTIFSDTPSINGGYTSAQLFVGCLSRFAVIYSMKTDSEFVHRLQDEIRKRGAMDKLISDRAQLEISNKVKDILRHLCIDDWQSEPHFQHQNAAERRYRDIKRGTNRVLNMTGAPPETWLLCMQYVCFILNRTSLRSLNYKTPFERLHGQTPDISMIYRFQFWESVYFSRTDNHFPSQSDECAARFVGFSENVGHQMTYILLNSETQRIIYRSRIRAARHGENLRLNQPDNPIEPPIETPADSPDIPDNPPVAPDNPNAPPDEIVHTNDRPMAIIEDLIGRSYLTPPDDDGTRSRLHIVAALDALEQDRANHPENLRFRAANNDGTLEEIITYNELMNRLEADDGEDDIWRFETILDHDGPINSNDPHYKGSSWNLKILWENGETTWEPLSIIAATDPISCAFYGKEHNLLGLNGWKRFRRLAKRQKIFTRMVNQAKLQSFRNREVWKFGIQVPQSADQARELDKKYGFTKWADAENLEIKMIDEYNTFEDRGLGGTPPPGFKRITLHMVYDVKHDGRCRARLVADGHKTETPLEGVYSGVVSLRGLRLALFLGELNNLETWGADISSAYLCAPTREKLYTIADDYFRDRKGHTLIVRRALYGLKLSGKMWSEYSGDIFQSMGFKLTKTQDDIWIRDNGDHYEYIARYVDDLAIISKRPQLIIDTLKNDHGFKLKGVGPLEFHLGCGFYRDDEGNLCMSPTRYIERMAKNYEVMFGSKPSQRYQSPLEKGDHPELDTSDFLDVDGIKKYQSLIGAIQWAVSIGRFDVSTAVMTLSSFRANPRVGHLERAKRIVGYLTKMKYAAIKFRTSEPDMSIYGEEHYDWERTVYKGAREVIPTDAPEPRGAPVTIIKFVDANLMHNVITGHSVTGTLTLVNKTVLDWYSKKQATVETATYGSEFVAARTATEQMIDLRVTLRYLGANLRQVSYLFGDNQSVVKSSSIPHAKLHKRHVLLSFHRVREAIAAKILRFIHIRGTENPADILSKAWGYQQIWQLLRPLLFWQGATNDAPPEPD